MRLYCLCKGKNPINRVVEDPARERYKFPGVVVERRMEFVEAGVHQYLKDGSRHNPNVDAFVCPDCGAQVIRE